MRLLATLMVLGLALPTWADGRWAQLSESTRGAIQLRRTVRAMQRSGQLRIAHPEVAKRFSAELTEKGYVGLYERFENDYQAT